MKNKAKKPKILKTRKFLELNSFVFSLKFVLVTLLIFLKMTLEIVILDEFDLRNGLFLMLSLILQSMFFAFFLFLDFRATKKTSQIPKFCKDLTISTAILLEFFLVIFFRTLSDQRENYFFKVSQVFWDAQTLCLFFTIFSEKLTSKQKTSLFFAINFMILIMFILQNEHSKEIWLSVLNFLPNVFLFFVNLKGFFRIFDFNEPNLEEICGLMYQGFLILRKDSYEIIYISSKFSSSLSKLKSVKTFEDLNSSLHDLEEEKILVDKSDDQQSIIASINRNSLSKSNSYLTPRYKTKTNLLNTSKHALTRSKFKKLKDLLDASREKFELFMEKNVIRTYQGFNSAGELKELHIKNVQYKKQHCYCIYLENPEKINVLANLSKENEFQSRLLSSFSHEMRTPLNGSLPILEDILQNLKPCCKSSLYENVFAAVGSLKLLENTINDIIDFQALHSGEFYLNIQEINFMDVLNNVINLMKVQAERKGLEFKSKINEVPTIIMSDKNRIQQLLINLLSNAIKFTIKGFVEINVCVTKKSPDMIIQIQIKDSGVGIEDEKMEKMRKILNEFEIEKMQFLESTGCSFGIIISQNIAMALGSEEYGGLFVETKLSEGSTFTFYIVNRDDQRKLTERIESRMSRVCSVNNMDKASEVIALSAKTRKSMLSNPKVSDSPMLKKLRETTYQTIKSGILYGEDILNEEEALETPHHYLSQKIIMINDSFLNRGKHFIAHASNSNRNDSPSKIETKFSTSKNGTNFVYDNQRTNIQTQGSVHECTCNKILVVDDDIFNIRTMELLLTKEGFKCDSAFDGVEAIEKFKNKMIIKSSVCGPKCIAYRLILMDYQMPKKDGVQAAIDLQELIKEYRLPDIPIICCTAFDSNSLVTKCFQAGMKEVIFKPLDFSVLRNILRKWLK